MSKAKLARAIESADQSIGDALAAMDNRMIKEIQRREIQTALDSSFILEARNQHDDDTLRIGVDVLSSRSSK